jgi:hypothetical protein
MLLDLHPNLILWHAFVARLLLEAIELMKVTSSLTLAKKGDPHAIATILNKFLHAKGISVSIERHRQTLHILATAEQIPNQAKVVDFVQRCLEQMQPPNVAKVVVKGHAQNRRIAWKESFKTKPGQPFRQVQLSRRWLVEHPAAIRGWAGSFFLIIIMAIGGLGLWKTNFSEMANANTDSLWEYRLEHVDAILLEQTLMRSGHEGWELSGTPKTLSVKGPLNRDIYEVVFKRPLMVNQLTPEPIQAPYEGTHAINYTPLANSSMTGIPDATGYYSPDETLSLPPQQALPNPGGEIRYRTLNAQGQEVIQSVKIEPKKENTPVVPVRQQAAPKNPPPLPVPVAP